MSMNEDDFWPHSLVQCRLDDHALDQAYTATHAQQRACIKQTLAFTHAFWGQCPDTTTLHREDRAQGFCIRVQDSPRPWTIAIVSPAYAAPTRLASALMCAILAKVPHIALLCLGGMPSVPVRVALELTGVEDIFCPCFTKTEETTALIHTIRALPHTGAVLLFHTGAFTPLRESLRTEGIVVWEENTPPTLHIEADAPHNKDILGWCHPDAPLQTATTDTIPHMPPDALYTTHESSGTAPLCLLPQTEGVWLHADLSPHTFRTRALHAAVYPHGNHP